MIRMGQRNTCPIIQIARIMQAASTLLPQRKIGLTFQQAIRKSDAYAGQFPTEVIRAAYNAGVQDYRAQVTTQQAELIKARKKKALWKSKPQSL